MHNQIAINFPELVLFGIYSIFFVSVFAIFVRNKFGKTFLAQLLVFGLIVKISFVILRFIISIQVFGGGSDTYKYYEASQGIHDAINEDVFIGIEMLSKNGKEYSLDAKDFVRNGWVNRASTLGVIKIASLFSLISFRSYLVISLFFGLLSFIGSYLIFKCFYEIYPRLYKEIVLACFFIPSVVFWSNLISKDAIAFFALGVFAIFIKKLVFNRTLSIGSTILAIIGVILLINIKVYILMSFLLAIFAVAAFSAQKKFKETALRIVVLATTLLIFGVLGFVLKNEFGKSSGKLSNEGLAELTENVQEGIEAGGSFYKITTFSLTPQGLVLGSLSAANVALFRPYPWEANRPILVPSAIEAFLTLLFTFWVFLRRGVRNIWKALSTDSVLQFCVVFSIIFAIITGLFSFTFGSLVRYKVPFVPFYFTLLFVLLNHPLRKTKIYESPSYSTTG